MDIIYYVDDLVAFRAEAIAILEADPVYDEDGKEIVNPMKKHFMLDENGELVYTVAKTPVQYGGQIIIPDPEEPEDTLFNESIALIRVSSAEHVTSMTNGSSLGECVDGEYVFTDGDTQAPYERIYPRETITIDMEDGGTVDYTPPYMIGVFS